MNPKKEMQEREQARVQEHEQERQQEAARTTPEEATGRGETRPRGEGKRDDLWGREQTEKQTEKQPGVGEHDPHAEHTRDLADGYEGGQRHRIIGGNLSGQTPRQLAREFGLVRELRPDIEKPVHHVSISAGKNDRLGVEQWQEIAAEYIEKMNFQNSPHIVIQHRGTERDHIHIVASRVDEDGQVVSEWRSKQRAEKVMRAVEEKYNLQRLPMSREVMRAAPSRAETEVFERTGKLSAKMSIQGHVERALRAQPTATEFIENLERVGVEVIPNLQGTGRVCGITFRQGEELMKGSDIGRGCSWGALQKRGLSYDPQRDGPTVEAAWQRAGISRSGVSSVAPPPVPELEYATTFGAQDVARSAGQYLLDSVNPIKQIERDFHTLQQLGQLAVDGYKAVENLMPGQDSVERLQQVAGIEPTGREAVERLHQAAGLELSQDSRDALERLNAAAGVERSDPTNNPDLIADRTPGAAPTLEPVIEREAEEQVIELGIELLL